MTVPTFARAVVAYRDQTSASVISWGRTSRNQTRAGRPLHSYHLIDLAVDVVYDKRLDLPTVRALAHALGLALRREAEHDHLEPLPEGGQLTHDA